MVIVKATKESEASIFPDEKILTEKGRYNEELIKAAFAVTPAASHALELPGNTLHL